MLQTIPASLLWREAVDSRTNAYVRRWMRHFPAIRATCIEQWPDALRAAAVPGSVHSLTAEERDLLVDEHWRRQTERPGHEPDEFDGLIEVLDRLILEAQERSEVGAAFVRLGSRAPIDSPTAQEGGLQVDGGNEALEVLLESERVFDDLCLAQECNYAPALVVRPWLELQPWGELRAFIRGRALIGISQRRTDRAYPQLAARAADLEVAVVKKTEELARHWPLEDVVADLVLVGEELQLLDVHPFLPWTDSALFSWDDPRSFEENKFRFLT